jgi:tRNA pseudouridine55 synthase
VTLADLEAMDEADRLACLLPVDALLDGYARVTLDSDNAGRFLSGLRRRGDWPDCAQLAVYGPAPDAALLGSAHSVAGELIPTRLLSPIEVSQCVAQHSAAAQLESVVL